MKKFLAVLVVLAITCVSAMAFAAEVTVGGSLEIRSRNFDNLQVLPTDVPVDALLTTAQRRANDQTDTQNRIRIDVNAKTDNVKAKLQLNNDFDTWGSGAPHGVETYSSTGATMGYREAWMNFNLPGIPVNVNVGHQLLKLGHGYFFKSEHFGSDAWVVANVTGANTVAFVNVKALEGNTFANDDMDAYVLLDVFKLADKMAIGIDLTQVNDRRAALTTPGGMALSRGLAAGSANPYKDIVLNNIGVNFTGSFGPLNLKAQADMQSGKAKSSGLANAGIGTPTGVAPDAKFKGNEIILKGDMAAGPATVNFTLARGTGNSATDTDIKQFVTILDIDPHVAFLYEYKVPTAAVNAVSRVATDDALHTGFANTTALNLGAGMDVAKGLNLAAQFWFLKATKSVAINGAVEPLLGVPATSKDVGMELDVKATWKLYDNLTWTWDLGYFMPGDAYRINDPVTGALKDADAVTGIQGVLAFKF